MAEVNQTWCKRNQTAAMGATGAETILALNTVYRLAVRIIGHLSLAAAIDRIGQLHLFAVGFTSLEAFKRT